MGTRWARVGRGTLAAALATFVAALSHVAAGGGTPPVFGIAVSLVISAMICTTLAGRTPSLLRLTVSVALSQVLFHALFSGLGTPVVAQHDMTTMAVDAVATHTHTPSTMWLAHAVAGFFTVVALRYAESAYWGVSGTARLLLARLLPVVLPRLGTAHSAAVRVVRRFIPRDLELLLSPMRHRGPPLQVG